MEDSFRVRVDKIFGSLASSSSPSSSIPSSSSLSTLWTLTDAEIERKEWSRDKEESPEAVPNPIGFVKNSMDYCSELENDLEDLDDGDLESDPLPRASAKPDDYDDEEWEIKSSIGLDCTLDYEEEEDKYDKVAVGREKAGDRLYMRDMADYVSDVDSCNEIPNSFKDINRDPRANHLAAKIRLKEDAEAAKKIDSLRVSEKDAPEIVDRQTNLSEDCINLKSILKRKNNQLNSKSEKRVRFDPGCKKVCDDEEKSGAKDILMGSCLTGDATVSNKVSLPQDFSSAVPDYIRNPSKYTHYTFDSSSDIDEKSNRQACMDFLKQLRSSNSMEPQPGDALVGLPKTVTFIPKRKTGDATIIENCTELNQNQVDVAKGSMNRSSFPISIGAGDTDREVCAMEEDEPEAEVDRRNFQKPGRKYRTKPRLESD